MIYIHNKPFQLNVFLCSLSHIHPSVGLASCIYSRVGSCRFALNICGEFNNVDNTMAPKSLK